MASSTSAQSSTLLQMGPSLSMDHDRGIAPVRGTRPNVGRSPVAPQRVAGDEMEPSVSLPSANQTSPAAVAAEEPADDPLEPCSGFHGFRVLPPNQVSPMASSPRVSLATRTAPASSSRLTTVAVSISCSRYGAAPQVVGAPDTPSRSFAPQGMPCSGPR